MVHPFSTEKFMRETTLPALERGLSLNGRTLADLEVAFPLMVIVAGSEEELDAGRTAMRPRLAFYGSTPAYKVALDAHGWGDLQPELNRLSKTGDWATMASLITDEIVDTFVVSGRPEDIGGLVRKRYGDMVQRVSFDTPNTLDGEQVAQVLDGFR
jgi:alkanesulfonate monooxygenase SsuD/methylene tetrahydromethanopterin reductase-like flavin-dependent oxidoreductase (luciferase family)